MIYIHSAVPQFYLVLQFKALYLLLLLPQVYLLSYLIVGPYLHFDFELQTFHFTICDIQQVVTFIIY